VDDQEGTERHEHQRGGDGDALPVVAGERDGITTPDDAAELAALIPGAKLTVIPCASHLSLTNGADGSTRQSSERTLEPLLTCEDAAEPKPLGAMP